MQVNYTCAGGRCTHLNTTHTDTTQDTREYEVLELFRAVHASHTHATHRKEQLWQRSTFVRRTITVSCMCVYSRRRRRKKNVRCEQ